MYPNLYYFFEDIFGIQWQWLKFINSFGFFVAIAFIVGAVVLTSEMKRKERLGLLTYQEAEIMVGKGPNWTEVFLNAFFGFLIGFKFIGGFFETEPVLNDPQGYLISSRGSMLMGILLAAVAGGLKYWQGQKEKLPKAEKRIIRIWPHDRVGDIIIMAAIFGFAGAKIFHNLENWDDFIKAPMASIFSAGGFTFYGGLICATVAIVLFAKKHKIGLWHLADTFGPAMMIAYAVGRIGCQVSGDGDWGIPNSAYTADAHAKVVLADSTGFQKAIANNLAYYKEEFKTLGEVKTAADVPHLAVKAPGWLPDWFMAYSYPHNVNEVGVKLANCTDDKYCTYLPAPVFPTPFYETIACTLLFLVLWALRKRIKAAGVIAGIYLVFNGIERFLVEKIRVNTHYHIFGLEPTQAEIISFFLVLVGLAIIVWRSRVKTSVA
ncbi:MAG: prolipoprotein diacylglyceryl transferase family protein [Bacteroidota bacterium]